jgi:hypothetical protein
MSLFEDPHGKLEKHRAVEARARESYTDTPRAGPPRDARGVPFLQALARMAGEAAAGTLLIRVGLCPL